MPSALAFEARGTGEPVLLLHGFMQTRRSWDRLLPELGQRRFVLPDLPGHGASAGVPANWRAAVEATLAVMPEPAHIAGYSLGGRLALAVAAAAPERILSLATIGAHAGFDEPEREARRAADFELAARVEREGIDWFAGYWAALPLFAGLAALGPEPNRELDAMRRSLDAGGVAASLRGMGAGATVPFWEGLSAIKVPALFLAGEHDHKYAAYATRLARAVPLGHAALVPGAGHPAHLERPQAVAGMLVSHWDQAR